MKRNPLIAATVALAFFALSGGCTDDDPVSRNHLNTGRHSGPLTESEESEDSGDSGTRSADPDRTITAVVDLEVGSDDGVPTAAASSYSTDSGECEATWEFSEASTEGVTFSEMIKLVSGDEVGCNDATGSIVASEGGFQLTRSVERRGDTGESYELVWSGELLRE
jgi:hypothetical protein